MKKTLYSGLLAAALLSLTLTSCGSSPTDGDDDVATTELPPLPAAPDSTKGAKQPTPVSYPHLTLPTTP